MRQSHHNQLLDLVINYLQQVKHYKIFLSLSIYRSITTLQTLSLSEGLLSSKLELFVWILSRIILTYSQFWSQGPSTLLCVLYTSFVATIFHLHTVKGSTNFPTYIVQLHVRPKSLYPIQGLLYQPYHFQCFFSLT